MTLDTRKRSWGAALAALAWLVAGTAGAGPRALVEGTVRTAQGAPIGGAEVTADTGTTVKTDADGRFRLELEAGRHTLTIARAGYLEATRTIDVASSALSLDVALASLARFTDNVTVSAVRAPDEAPISKRDIPRAEIEARNYGQEMPFLLEQVPSITQYADSGAPAGYSYIFLRGIPQTRLNVTIDGMPINEPEDSAFYFSDFGDFANAVDSIQVQRGVGTSSVGAASFVGSINFASAAFKERPEAVVRLGAGSFGQQRFSGTLNSGELAHGVRLYGQVAVQDSDGFREHSGVSQKSVYLGLQQSSDRSFFKVFGFAGRERTQLAYLAADEATLETNLRANPMSPDERDQFDQRFVTAQYHRLLGPRSDLAVQGFLNSAGGWYRVGSAEAEPSGLFQYGLSWRNLGGSVTYHVSAGRADFTWGTFFSDFKSEHTRDVVEGPTGYINHGYKSEFSTYAKATWSRGRWLMFGDAQLRHARFRYSGDLPLHTVDWTFFNPKVGTRFDLGHGVSLYGSVGHGSREPARSDMLQGEDNATIVYDLTAVRPEQVLSAEFGANLSFRGVSAQVNGYLMSFRHEIAQTGELSEIGLPLRRNVDRSHRRGVEIDLTWKPVAAVQIRHTATYSRNRIDSWTQFYDVYDTGGNWIGATSQTHLDVPPYVTPAVLATLSGDYAPSKGATVGAAWRYVGESHLDNTGREDFTAPGFGCLDLHASLDLARVVRAAGALHPTLRLQVNNVLDNRRMFPNGYSYQYFVGSVVPPAVTATSGLTLEGTRYYYPLATRSAAVTLEVRF